LLFDEADILLEERLKESMGSQLERNAMVSGQSQIVDFSSDIAHSYSFPESPRVLRRNTAPYDQPYVTFDQRA